MAKEYSKQNRLHEILRIIQEEPVARQEELLEKLQARGYKATQATISRDIRELGLTKTNVEGKGYCYTAKSIYGESGPRYPKGRFETIFRESVLHVDHAGHIVLVKCYNGMANAACELFDALQWSSVVGTLAGDDTFFILARTERDAKSICGELNGFIKK